MEEVVKNANTFLHILAEASTHRVGVWDGVHLKRALDWADHHQKLFLNYRDKDRARSNVDVELRKLTYRNCVLINLFSFAFLYSCKDYLICTLRGNPALPPSLLPLLPLPREDTPRVNVFGGLLSLARVPGGDLEGVLVREVCMTIREAVSLDRSCPLSTKAPARAIQTLLTRAHGHAGKGRGVFLRCFVAGCEVVRGRMVGWLETHGSDLWTVSGVREVVRCSQAHPGFCKLHLMFIVGLLEQLHYGGGLRTISNLDLRRNVDSESKRLIFEKESEEDNTEEISKQDLIKRISEHIIVLHATDRHLIVEELLGTIARNPKFNLVANRLLKFCSG